MSTKICVSILLACAACGTDAADTAPSTYAFGPFTLTPGQELTDLCVSATLHNEAPIYVNSIDMAGATGIHHSNWFWVPDSESFVGPDGSWSCSEHNYDQAAAALFGGVLFAQSTQATQEEQAFPPGAAIKIPPHSRIVANLHLLNSTDGDLGVPISLTLHPIAEADATTVLAGFALENESIALPPQAASSFSVDCDLSPTWQRLYAGGLVASDHVDIKIYHALAHYHALGTALAFEAIRDSDGGVDTVWSTSQRIGDELGGMLDPPFDLTGHSKVRVRCTYDNPGDTTIRWGNGGAEMCIAFAFTDSTYVWNAGVLTQGDPGPSVMNNGTIDFTTPGCSVVTTDAQH